VRRLTVRQLLPPLNVVPDAVTGECLVLSATDSAHFDFNQVLPQVCHVIAASVSTLFTNNHSVLLHLALVIIRPF